MKRRLLAVEAERLGANARYCIRCWEGAWRHRGPSVSITTAALPSSRLRTGLTSRQTLAKLLLVIRRRQPTTRLVSARPDGSHTRTPPQCLLSMSSTVARHIPTLSRPVRLASSPLSPALPLPVPLPLPLASPRPSPSLSLRSRPRPRAAKALSAPSSFSPAPSLTRQTFPPLRSHCTRLSPSCLLSLRSAAGRSEGER